ncbi:MAG TPA: ABC transporter permease subunit [Petrotogaceae bacterium]|nr:ABC transporter permease subunit [Petrotogaceae bacterium]
MSEEVKKNVPVNGKNPVDNNDGDIFEKEFLTATQLAWRTLRRHKLGMVAMVILIIFYFFAIFADFFSPMNPYNNHIQYRFAQPQKIRTKDFVTNERSGQYVLLYDSVRDLYTKQKSFVEATHYEAVKAYDINTEKEELFELGKFNETYGATVTEIVSNFTVTYKAKLKNGSYVELGTETETEKPLIPVSYVTGDNTTGQYEKDGNLLKPSFSKFLTGNAIYTGSDSRTGAIEELLEEYGSEVAIEDVQTIDTFYTFDSMYIRTENFDEVEVTPADLRGVSFKKYYIKYFVKSWDYKLLGFIPTNIHFMGTEKPVIESIADYLSNDGILYIWGSDKFGRDMFSRILYGSRISLSIGLVAILITFTIGLFLGGFAGYYGGWTDEILMRITEILMSIPSFYLIISLSSILPSALDPTIRYLFIIIILSFIGWPGMTRVIRGMTLGIKQTEFIEAAVALGYPPRRIIWKHLIPNTTTYIIVNATLSIPSYILGEAGLSFLGVGITEPGASWGLMLSQAQSIEALTNYPWLLLPGLFIFLTVMSFNLFGDALRDALDPRALGK